MTDSLREHQATLKEHRASPTSASLMTSGAGDQSAFAVAPPPPSATWGAYAAAAAAIAFVPLHLVWALGIPLWVNEAFFDRWHHDGGGTYLAVLNVLAVLPAVLALALVRPWGLTFPRWTPVFAGRGVPRMLLIAPAAALSVCLLGYATFAAFTLPGQWHDPAAIFSPWIVVFGIPQFIVWAGGLLIATRSYARRTVTKGVGWRVRVR
jgi:small-conductance mechanosensitive channel